MSKLESKYVQPIVVKEAALKKINAIAVMLNREHTTYTCYVYKRISNSIDPKLVTRTKQLLSELYDPRLKCVRFNNTFYRAIITREIAALMHKPSIEQCNEHRINTLVAYKHVYVLELDIVMLEFKHTTPTQTKSVV